MRLVACLQYAERVNIKAQRDRRPLTAVQCCDDAGKAAARDRKKFRVRAVFLRPFVMRFQRIGGGKAHPRVRLADGRTGQDLIAEVCESACEQGGRAHFHPARLGKAVEITPDGRQLR